MYVRIVVICTVCIICYYNALLSRFKVEDLYGANEAAMALNYIYYV